MGLLDIMRSVVAPTAAARTGYLAGQEQGREKRRTRQREDAATQRQSRIDQMQEELHRSQVTEHEARADYYRRRPVTGSSTAPKTLDTDQGIMQWDAAQGKYVPSGFKKSMPASERHAGAREARESRVEKQGQLSGVNKQIDDTRAEMRDVPNDVSLDDKGVTSRVGQLRARLDSLTGVSDSLNTVIKGGKAGPTKRAITKDQADYLRTEKKMSDAEIQRRYRVAP